jgi:alkylation response protein AidB-like acyl-CoA dehydrogenase
MVFELGESRLLYKSTVERFVAPFDSGARLAQRNEPAGFSRSRWRAMAELGLFHLPIAESEGGIGGDAADCEVVAQALGYGLAVEPWLECGFWPGFLLQGQAVAAEIASGDRICAVAASERRFEGEWQPRMTVAELDGGSFRRSGGKTLVLGGADADCFLVTALHRGETLGLIVPRDAPGLGIRPYRVVDGGWAVEVALDDVAVPADAAVCTADRIRQSVAAAMLIASAELVGIGQGLFEETVAFV